MTQALREKNINFSFQDLGFESFPFQKKLQKKVEKRAKSSFFVLTK
jgi:hypothetical protein